MKGGNMMCSVVLHVPGFLSGFSGILPYSKCIPVRSVGNSKMSKVSMSVNGCLSVHGLSCQIRNSKLRGTKVPAIIKSGFRLTWFKHQAAFEFHTHHCIA